MLDEYGQVGQYHQCIKSVVVKLIRVACASATELILRSFSLPLQLVSVPQYVGKQSVGDSEVFQRWHSLSNPLSLSFAPVVGCFGKITIRVFCGAPFHSFSSIINWSCTDFWCCIFYLWLMLGNVCIGSSHVSVNFCSESVELPLMSNTPNHSITLNQTG